MRCTGPAKSRAAAGMKSSSAAKRWFNHAGRRPTEAGLQAMSEPWSLPFSRHRPGRADSNHCANDSV
jgi:hypothetical protein